jgi:hypothetical protein
MDSIKKKNMHNVGRVGHDPIPKQGKTMNLLMGVDVARCNFLLKGGDHFVFFMGLYCMGPYG